MGEEKPSQKESYKFKNKPCYNFLVIVPYKIGHSLKGLFLPPHFPFTF